LFKLTFGSEDTTQVRVLPLQGYLKVIWFHVDEKLYMAQAAAQYRPLEGATTLALIAHQS